MTTPTPPPLPRRPPRARACAAPLRRVGRLGAALLVWAACAPGAAAGQTLLDLLAAVRQGGGWIDIPVERGRGSLLTSMLPTAGLGVAGCIRLWGGHSGTWDIRVRDTQGSSRLDAVVRPNQPLPFVYRAGPLSQLDVQVRWSEPRDTTLVMWVGLGGGVGGTGRDPCEPVFGPAPGSASEQGRGTRAPG